MAQRVSRAVRAGRFKSAGVFSDDTREGLSSCDVSPPEQSKGEGRAEHENERF
jgi:hypothetical protein